MENYIQKNWGKFLEMIFSTLDRKEVTDIEGRNNYKEVLLDYCQFLYQLSPIPNNSVFSSQQKFLERLDTLFKRYQNIGVDFIETDNLETFLITLQKHMSDYLHQDLQSKLYAYEKEYYSKLAWDANNYTHIKNNTHEFQNEQQNAIERLISKGPNFEKFKNNMG
jgi:hypothetical protein